jgi:phage shock protein PspC (stress-responsive transcriptional regulator)
VNQERLYRSVDDRVIAGVCGGLADRLGVDPSLVRIMWVLLTVASGGLFFLLYIVMAIVVPEDEQLPYFPPAPMPPPGAPGEAGTPAAGLAEASTSGAPGVAAPGGPPPGGSWGQPASEAQWRAQARAERRAARAARRAQRPGQASMVLGVILVLLGIWFLLEEYVPAFDAGRFWPFVIIFLGVVLLAFAFGGWPGSRNEPKS